MCCFYLAPSGSSNISEFIFSTDTLEDKVVYIKIISQLTLLTTRWPNILLVSANWSGGRLASFLGQGLDCEPQWLTMFFMSLGVVMVITASQSYRGIQPMSLGNQLEALLLQDLTMQLLQSMGAQFCVHVCLILNDRIRVVTNTERNHIYRASHI